MYVPKGKNMDEMISEHATNRVSRMEIGDVTNCKDLFGSALWYSLTDLEKHRKTLLLRKSMGNATEEDLKQLARVLDLINKVEPSIAAEIMGQKDAEDSDLTKN